MNNQNCFNRIERVKLQQLEFVIKINVVKDKNNLAGDIFLDITCPSDLEILTSDIVNDIRTYIRTLYGESEDVNVNIININLNDGLKEIGIGALSKTRVAKLILPSTVEIINDRAFEDCWNLKEIVLNEGILIIGSDVFRKTNITKLILPTTLRYIGTNMCGKEAIRLKEIIVCEDTPLLANGKVSLERKIKGNFNEHFKRNVIVMSKDDFYREQKCYSEEFVNGKMANVLGLKLLKYIIDYGPCVDNNKVFKLLVDGANPNVKDDNGNTAVMYMIDNGNDMAVFMYIAFGYNVSLQNNHGEDALIKACLVGNNSLANMLIDVGCDLHHQTITGLTALSIAKDYNNTSLVVKIKNDMAKESSHKTKSLIQK